MRKLLLLLAGVLLMSATLMAQNRTVSGKVTDETGKGVSKASVTVKGSQKLGTLTAEDGTFTLSVPENSSTLIISSVGFVQSEIPIGNGSDLAIQMKSLNSDMSEVVVVAYGTAKKETLTGSV